MSFFKKKKKNTAAEEAESIQQEILKITEKNQEHAKEILDIVNNFKQENRFESV